MARSLKELNEYYKNQGRVDSVLREDLRGDDEIVYGARAVNAVLPDHLDKQTEDWDIMSKTPKKAAFEAERKLDTAFGGDFFETKPAIHPGTWKVKSKVTKRGVADFTKQEKKTDYHEIDGIRFATLDHQKDNIKRSLADPESRFRHDKDKETRQRIKIYESKYKKKEVRRPKQSRSLFSGGNLFDGWL